MNSAARIDTLFQPQKPTVSFEFFPPKDEAGFTSLYRTIDRLKPLEPSYVSVTYGAGGSTRQKTVDLAGKIQNEIGFRVLAHLTCVEHTKDEIAAILDQLWEHGVRNILALRGDPPGGARVFTPTPGGFAHSTELVAFIRDRFPDACIGVAGYPEGHIHCLNRIRDLEHLKEKVDAGGNFIVTQLFFDNGEFYKWRNEAREMGIHSPIVAGIMPIVSVSGVKRMVSLSGARIPHPLLQKLEAVEVDEEAVAYTGVEHAVMQCRDLQHTGVDGIHFYTLNRSRATVDIYNRLNDEPSAA